MTKSVSLSDRIPVNIFLQDDKLKNSYTQKNISIVSAENTSISKPSCFSGLMNQAVGLWHRFIRSITCINKHSPSITTLNPSINHYTKYEGNDVVKNSSIINKQENGLYIKKKENTIEKTDELLSASKYTEKYLKVLLNGAPSALVILATNTELKENTCDEVNKSIFFQYKNLQKYGDINILSVKTSNTQRIGQLAISNYNITLIDGKKVTSIPVIHVINWLSVTNLDEDDKKNLLGHITEKINNRKKLSTPQFGYENKFSEPKKELFALSFKSNKSDAFSKNFSVIDKVI